MTLTNTPLHPLEQEQIGNLLNSEEWKKSGIDLKGDAGENIKKAFEDFKAQGGSEKASQLADSGMFGLDHMPFRTCQTDHILLIFLHARSLPRDW